jgi:cold shock protein
MARGRVKWFNKIKGYGFVSLDVGDAFVHHSAISGGGFKALKEGDIVECDVATTSKGLQALNVQVIGDPRASRGRHTTPNRTPQPQPTKKVLSDLPRSFSPSDPAPSLEPKKPKSERMQGQSGNQAKPQMPESSPAPEPAKRRRAGRKRQVVLQKPQALTDLVPPPAPAVSKSDDTEWWR